MANQMQSEQSPATVTDRDAHFLESYNLTGKLDMQFFTRQPLLLVLYMALSLGMYGVYWFYRNWQVVREASGHKMMPFWRAFFSFVWAWPLFKIMVLQARARGSESGCLVAALYVIPGLFMFNGAVQDTNTYAVDNLSLGYEIIVSIIAAIALMQVQQLATYNVPVKQIEPYSQVDAWELFWVLVLCVLPVLAVQYIR